MTDWVAISIRIGAASFAAAIVTALLLDAQDNRNPQLEDNSDLPFSGTLLLEQFRCRRAESLHHAIHGIEDGYRTDNREVARFDRSGGNQPVGIGIRNYDDIGFDADLFDYFEFPPETASGLFVVRMGTGDHNINDVIIIGSFADNVALARDQGARVFRDDVVTLGTQPGWSRRSDVFWISLEDIRLESGESLVDFVRDPSRDGIVDLMIGDDTVVDFAGFAYCTEPEFRNAMTFWVEPASRIDDRRETHHVVATCYPNLGVSAHCDPFIGDTVCNRSLPLACYRDDRFEVPGDGLLRGVHAHVGPRYWSGGEIALTPPVPASDFATIGDANAFCQAEFGEDWRVADFHLGGQGFLFSGVGETDYSGRAWIDIRDQPYATCWARE